MRYLLIMWTALLVLLLGVSGCGGGGGAAPVEYFGHWTGVYTLQAANPADVNPQTNIDVVITAPLAGDPPAAIAHITGTATIDDYQAGLAVGDSGAINGYITDFGNWAYSVAYHGGTLTYMDVSYSLESPGVIIGTFQDSAGGGIGSIDMDRQLN